ncbi:MAG TPA: hypothetical protein VJC06_04095 [Candidatus Paceibacterota bacterium]
MNMGKIYLIESESRQDLAQMFMRFQEYYESPEFKGKTFTVDEFAHWYTSKYGSFSYAKDWYGFNIPARVLAPFRQGNFDPLTVQEQKLLEICKEVNDNSYIIGVTPDAEYFKETIQHEFVHGVFYTNPEYRKEVEACIKDHDIKPINQGLRKMGYCNEVAIDETNAYILTEPDTMKKFISVRNTHQLKQQLESIFKKYFGYFLTEIEVSNLMNRTRHILV